MSWSISFIGQPVKVIEALKEESAKLTGQSKIEYDSALPHLVGLVENNFATDGCGYTPPLVKLNASGSGTARKDPSTGDVEKQLQRSCRVSLEDFYSKLV